MRYVLANRISQIQLTQDIAAQRCSNGMYEMPYVSNTRCYISRWGSVLLVLVSRQCESLGLRNGNGAVPLFVCCKNIITSIIKSCARHGQGYRIMKKYICMGCKSEYYEGNVPDKCPTCGCDAKFFKAQKIANDRDGGLGKDFKQKITNIGNFCIGHIIGLNLCALFIIFMVLGIYVDYRLCHPRISSTPTPTQQTENTPKTTESVYTGSDGTEVVICDNGIAYINENKGTWHNASVKIGNTDYSYIEISLNGMVEQGAICDGKYYYGRNAYWAIKEGFPDGEPLTKTRR